MERLIGRELRDAHRAAALGMRSVQGALVDMAWQTASRHQSAMSPKPDHTNAAPKRRHKTSALLARSALLGQRVGPNASVNITSDSSGAR